MIKDKVPTKLFLHMGPGFHSLIEKKLFAIDFPDVDFWSQPAISTFAELLHSAETKLSEMKSEKIDIYAHSFGAQIVLHLVQKLPGKIGKVVLLNSGTDPFECFLNLGLNLGLLGESDLAKIRSSPVTQKMELVIKIAMSPNFPSRYWYSEEKMKKYSSLFMEMPQLDVNVFSQVFADFLVNREKFHGQLKAWNGDVTVIASQDDVLLNYQSDVATWTKYFSKAHFKTLSKLGHYAHIESDDLGKTFFK